MLLPEVLYRLNKREEQIDWIEPFIQGITGNTINSTNFSAFVEMPEDRILILTAVSATAFNDVGNMTDILIELLNPQETEAFPLARRQEFAAGAGSKFLNYVGETLVPPRWKVQLRVVVSVVPVVAHTSFAGVHGFLLPRANISSV